MYMWQVIGHDASQGTLRCGIGADLAAIMRLIEEDLVNARGFVGHIMEVVPRMSVFHLEPIHVATGREWHGRRDKNGGVYWESRYCPGGADLAYSAPEGSDSSDTGEGARRI